MTAQETGQIMDILSYAYPQFYRSYSEDDMFKGGCLWTDMFASDNVSTVAMAVKALIASDTKGFPPHIGAVKEYIRKITAPQEMTEQEAWGIVKKALGRVDHYNPRKTFEKLPEELQQIVGSPATLREWCLMDIDDLNTVVASNFQRSYRAKIEHIREYQKLPAAVREFTAQLASGMNMKRLGDGR